jgi:hypothetical protein
MGRKEKKRRKQLAAFERRADERTARFVAARLEDIQQDLADLLADLRTFDHYEQVVDVGLCMWRLQDVKRKYEKFAEKGAWDDPE